MKSVFTFVAAGVIMISVIFTSCTGSKSLYLENPATVKCIKDGGSLKLVKGEHGDYGLCLFNDGSFCEEWNYFRGECQTGECIKKCDKAGSTDEGWYDCNGKLLFKEQCSQ